MKVLGETGQSEERTEEGRLHFQCKKARDKVKLQDKEVAALERVFRLGRLLWHCGESLKTKN